MIVKHNPFGRRGHAEDQSPRGLHRVQNRQRIALYQVTPFMIKEVLISTN